MPLLRLNKMSFRVAPHVYLIHALTVGAAALEPQVPFSFLTGAVSFVIQLLLYPRITEHSNLHNLPRYFLHRIYLITALFQIFIVRLFVPQLLAFILTSFVRLLPHFNYHFVSWFFRIMYRWFNLYETIYKRVSKLSFQAVLTALLDPALYISRMEDLHLPLQVEELSGPFTRKTPLHFIASGIGTSVLAKSFRSSPLFLVVPTEILKAFLITNFIKTYQKKVRPPFHINDIFIISLVIGMAIASVQVSSSSQWAYHVTLPWMKDGMERPSMVILVFIALCVYAGNMISCALLAIRSAENVWFRRRHSLWVTRVLSLSFCLFFNFVVVCTMWTIPEKEARLTTCGTLLAIILSSGLFVWFKVVETIFDENSTLQQQRTQQPERLRQLENQN